MSTTVRFSLVSVGTQLGVQLEEVDVRVDRLERGERGELDGSVGEIGRGERGELDGSAGFGRIERSRAIRRAGRRPDATGEHEAEEEPEGPRLGGRRRGRRRGRCGRRRGQNGHRNVVLQDHLPRYIASTAPAVHPLVGLSNPAGRSPRFPAARRCRPRTGAPPAPSPPPRSARSRRRS